MAIIGKNKIGLRLFLSVSVIFLAYTLLFMGYSVLREREYKKELAMIIEEFLKQRIEGFKNESF